jgi:DNA-directed RNA polymerase subunit RPC12/RpoP
LAKVKVLECKYCDNSFPPRNYDGDLVCSRCGAEWEDAKILVEYDDSEFEDDYDED